MGTQSSGIEREIALLFHAAGHRSLQTPMQGEAILKTQGKLRRVVNTWPHKDRHCALLSQCTGNKSIAPVPANQGLPGISLTFPFAPQSSKVILGYLVAGLL